MKIAFFVSSVGDTDLALNTIKSMEQANQYEILLISLTDAAQKRVEGFQSSLPLTKKSLPEIINSGAITFPDRCCSEEQLGKILLYIHQQEVKHAYFGVPSVNNEIPFQIAASLDDVSILMAYEFMFKPEEHCLWNYLSDLKNKPKVQWALPLVGATKDFDIVNKSKIHIIGHLSIDNAYSLKPVSSKKPEEIKQDLQITKGQSLAFVSSTTQPVAVDAKFLDCLLAELPKHSNIEVRLGIHPGIQDLDAYLSEILAVCKEHLDTCDRFKIILPDNLLGRIKTAELSIENPQFKQLFLRANINGSEASSVADRVAQAVPGALLNQAALEGKPAYSHSGKPYLPQHCFSKNIATFFSSARKHPCKMEELDLDEKTAAERCALVVGASCLSMSD